VKNARAAKSVGTRITESLQEFADVLEKGIPFANKYLSRVVQLHFQPASFSPQDVRETRRLLSASQTVFAALLGVYVQTVRAWEQGSKNPNDMARRFLDEIRRNPAYWLGRLRDAAAAG
jgi:DNA-binding transcriptional regulator YiaG